MEQDTPLLCRDAAPVVSGGGGEDGLRGGPDGCGADFFQALQLHIHETRGIASFQTGEAAVTSCRVRGVVTGGIVAVATATVRGGVDLEIAATLQLLHAGALDGQGYCVGEIGVVTSLLSKDLTGTNCGR